MDIWKTYQNRLSVHGKTKRDASYIREVRYIDNKLPDNLSYHTVNVYPADYSYNIESENSIAHCISQSVAILNSDNLNEKTIYSMPHEDIHIGSLICWMDNYWLVTERDANTTIYTRAKLIQCNHLLKWISADKEIIKQWSVVSDGTKYMVGETEDRNFVVTRPDTRIQIQIAKNKLTTKLTRENRFLIDDDDTPHKMAYLLTKPYKRGYTYNGDGIFSFLAQEVTATKYDNHELGIADYYRYFPDEMAPDGSLVDDNEQIKGEGAWL